MRQWRSRDGRFPLLFDALGLGPRPALLGLVGRDYSNCLVWARTENSFEVAIFFLLLRCRKYPKKNRKHKL